MDPLLLTNIAIELAQYPEGCRLLVSLSLRKGFTNPHEWCDEERIRVPGMDRHINAKEIIHILKTFKTEPPLFEFKKAQGFIGFLEYPHVRLTYQGQMLADLLKSRKCVNQSCGFWDNGKCCPAS